MHGLCGTCMIVPSGDNAYVARIPCQRPSLTIRVAERVLIYHHTVSATSPSIFYNFPDTFPTSTLISRNTGTLRMLIWYVQLQYCSTRLKETIRTRPISTRFQHSNLQLPQNCSDLLENVIVEFTRSWVPFSYQTQHPRLDQSLPEIQFLLFPYLSLSLHSNSETLYSYPTWTDRQSWSAYDLRGINLSPNTRGG